MIKTQLILLKSSSDELKKRIATGGPIALPGAPSIVLSLPPKIAHEAGRVPLRRAVVEDIERNSIAIAWTYDSGVIANETVSHQLRIVAIALQLVKPTVLFLNLWLQLDSDNLTEMVHRPVSDLDRLLPGPYVQYQQHHCITEGDVR